MLRKISRSLQSTEVSDTIQNRVDGFIFMNLVRNLGITRICRNLKKYKLLDYL